MKLDLTDTKCIYGFLTFVFFCTLLDGVMVHGMARNRIEKIDACVEISERVEEREKASTKYLKKKIDIIYSMLAGLEEVRRHE